MKIYLVGGAVRDQLLNLPVKERDYVVVGATVADMLSQGYRQVGKDFPVFLHHKTKEEYALARTERKTGRGYTGFSFDASPQVTLEEDLKRRDITINAIAQDLDTKRLIDPYGGKADLDKKILRHVSSAFVEDPVRILRVARFAARFAELGFTVAPETIELMKAMVQEGEVDALVAERVWKELERALAEKHPEKFFEVLKECGADAVLFDQQKDAFNLKALIRSVELSPESSVRFAALLQNQTEMQIKTLCDRYRIPTDYRELALLVARFCSQYQHATQLSAEELLNLLQSVDAFRRKDRFENFLLVCEACSDNSSSPFLTSCYQVAKAVDVKECINADTSGEEIKKKLLEKRKEMIEKLLTHATPSGREYD